MSGSIGPKVLASVAGAAGLAYGLEHLLPRMSRQSEPSFAWLPTQDGESKVTAVLFHGMQSGAEQWDPLLADDDNDLRSLFNVYLAVNGCDPWVMPDAIFSALAARGLLGHEIMLIGLSLGTHTAVATQRGPATRRFPARRHFMANPRRLASSMVLISGPASPRDAIWPSPLLEHGTRFLGGGLISRGLWQEMNVGALRDIYARYSEGELDYETAAAAAMDTARCLTITPTRMIRDTRRVHRGPGLRPGEFRDTEALVIERAGDERVRPCFPQWKQAFPLAEHHFIENPPGHATLGDCPEQYISAIRQWRESVLARRSVSRGKSATLRIKRRGRGPGLCVMRRINPGPPVFKAQASGMLH